MKIQESAENYLETILVLSLDKPYVRSIDIANELGFSKPSVSVAMGHLREGGMITTDEDGLLDFTEAGLELATDVYNRHCLLTDFLLFLGVSDPVAREDACKLEHDLSPESYQCLKQFMDRRKETQ